MIKLIGITGRARHGKDTLAGFLVEAGYRQVSFAAALKTVTAFIAGEGASLYHDAVSKEEVSGNLGMTRRRALQNVGNSMREALGDQVWVRRVMNQWHDSCHAPTVVSDVRYPNEAEAIRSAGGIVVSIVRPGHTGLEGEAAQHISEVPLPDDLVDYSIVNSGSLEELRAQALTLLEVVNGR